LCSLMVKRRNLSVLSVSNFKYKTLTNHGRALQKIAKLLLPFQFRNTNKAWGGISGETIEFNRDLRKKIIEQPEKFLDKSVGPLLSVLYNENKSGIDVLHRQMSHINDPHGKARRLLLHRIDIHLLGILNISKLSQIAKSAGAPPTVAQLRAKINRLSLRDVRNTIFRKFNPDSFNVFRNNEPIILNPTTILEEYDQY
jgi:hypothetical protein